MNVNWTYTKTETDSHIKYLTFIGYKDKAAYLEKWIEISILKYIKRVHWRCY